jgi:hypothetical protein
MKNFSVQYLLSHIDNKKDVPSAVTPSTITTSNTLNINSSDDVGKKIKYCNRKQELFFLII